MAEKGSHAAGQNFGGLGQNASPGPVFCRTKFWKAGSNARSGAGQNMALGVTKTLKSWVIESECTQLFLLISFLQTVLCSIPLPA